MSIDDNIPDASKPLDIIAELDKDKPEVPCNIWGLIKDWLVTLSEMQNNITDLQARLTALEVKSI